jgi:hypothetical protein
MEFTTGEFLQMNSQALWELAGLLISVFGPDFFATSEFINGMV